MKKQVQKHPTADWIYDEPTHYFINNIKFEVHRTFKEDKNTFKNSIKRIIENETALLIDMAEYDNIQADEYTQLTAGKED